MYHTQPTDLIMATASERLRRAGYRVTRQRLAVYSFLHGNESHPTADDIHAGVTGQFPRMSVATVYKSVESLVDVALNQAPVAVDELDRCEIIGSSVEFYGFCASCRRHKLGLDPN